MSHQQSTFSGEKCILGTEAPDIAAQQQCETNGSTLSFTRSQWSVGLALRLSFWGRTAELGGTFQGLGHFSV